MEDELIVTCPHCWQQVSFTIDLSVRAQSYVQDCEVCCNPLEITCVTNGREVVSFDVQQAQ